MLIHAIVQARFSSKRLPGKVVVPIGGRPMLGLLIERLAHAAGLDGICVATSDEVSDDPVAAFCAAENTDCHRGALNDVAGRLLQAADTKNADAFVRVNGDSPLLDPRLVAAAVARFRDTKPDLVSNVLVRTFPKGQSVEVIRVQSLRTVLSKTAQAEDLEHVTPYFYRNARDFHIESIENTRDASHVQLSVDTPEDLERVRMLAARFSRPQWTYGVDELLEMLANKAA